MNIFIKYKNGFMAIPVIAGLGRYTFGVVAASILIFTGCATVPMPVTIRHEKTPLQGYGSSSGEQRNREPADQRIADLLNLLQSKKVISVEEASRVSEKPEDRIERITESVSKEIIKELDEQIREQVINELSGKKGAGEELSGKSADNEQIRKIKRKVTFLSRQVSGIVGTTAKWPNRIRFSGDLRLRFQGDLFDSDNAMLVQPSNSSLLMNTTNNQNRFKYRLRFGAKARVNKRLDAVIRLDTGRTTNPVSTNIQMGDFMNKDGILLNLAYLKWKERETISIYGGKMPNPWFSSNLLWDSDLTFEGLAVNVKHYIAEAWTPFFTAGVFPLQFDKLSNKGKWLSAGQFGVEKKNRKGVTARLGAAFYYFSRLAGERNDPFASDTNRNDWTAPQFQQKGNTLFDISAKQDKSKLGLASDFKELNFTGKIDIGYWNPVHITFVADYVKNLGFKQSHVNSLVGDQNTVVEGFQAPPKEINGYKVGISVGYPNISKFGQWKTSLQYKRLEADAVLDAFTDSDFHLGGTNTKGWELKSDFKLSKSTLLTLRWLTADEISGPPLAIDTFQMDISANF